MTRHPPTLQDALDSGEVAEYQPATEDTPEVPGIPWRDKKHRPYREYQCDCGAWKRAGLIVDTRALDAGQDWACDRCWTRWQRAGRAVSRAVQGKPGRVLTVANRKEWRLQWLSAHQAPTEVRQKVEAMRTPDAYGRVRGGKIQPIDEDKLP